MTFIHIKIRKKIKETYIWNGESIFYGFKFLYNLR